MALSAASFTACMMLLKCRSWGCAIIRSNTEGHGEILLRDLLEHFRGECFEDRTSGIDAGGLGQHPFSFRFRNVAPLASGQLVTLHGLREKEGEVIDLSKHGTPSVACTFVNALAFGAGEELVLSGLNERPGEVISLLR